MDLFEHDSLLREQGIPLLAGVDEAGRGPLAGPVVAAAVILPSDGIIQGLDDSKKLSEKQRDVLYDEIIRVALAASIEEIDETIIDDINILGATLFAMEQAVVSLGQTPDLVLIDGNIAPLLAVPNRPIIKGDAISASIAAASILAKVTRDRFMIQQDILYPNYGFARHKGYPTKFHYEMLDKHGPCPIHRKSFLKKWRARHEEK